jgi:hypothetical protein
MERFMQLLGHQVALANWEGRYNADVWGDLNSAVRALINDEFNGEPMRHHCAMILENSDAWGRSFFYQLIRRDGQTVAVLRSAGPNGRREDGHGDDLTVEAILGGFESEDP